MSTQAGGRIEALIRANNWSRARRVIKAALGREPDSHWLVTRLSLTYYEERRYREALKWSERGLSLAPHCPLVLWDYAGALDMVGRPKEALAVYRRLIRRGVQAIAYGRCGEGLRWARSLVADCHYRTALCYSALGRTKLALRAFMNHLSMRGPGCRSIYPIREVRARMAACSGTRSS